MKVRQKLKACCSRKAWKWQWTHELICACPAWRVGWEMVSKVPWDWLTKLPSPSAVGTYQFRVPESTPPDSPVGRIKANDADVDENAEIEYSITEGDGYDMFGITTDKDTQEGIISVKKVLILAHLIPASEIPVKTLYNTYLFSIFSATCVVY